MDQEMNEDRVHMYSNKQDTQHHTTLLLNLFCFIIILFQQHTAKHCNDTATCHALYITAHRAFISRFAFERSGMVT